MKSDEPVTKPKVPEVPQVELEIQPEPAQNQSTVGELIQPGFLSTFKCCRCIVKLQTLTIHSIKFSIKDIKWI